MKTFVCSIVGVSPFLMHRWNEESEQEESTRTVHIGKRDPRVEAEKAAYRDHDGTLYFPGTMIARILRDAGSSHKQRGSRKSLRYIIPAAVIVLDEVITMRDTEGKPLSEFEVDSRPVTIPSTKGRIMRHRPRLNTWGAEFSIEVDPEMIDVEIVHQLLTESGKRLGLGDYRPSSGGPFGRFQVHSWKEIAALPADKLHKAA